jgi:hypothetical protein
MQNPARSTFTLKNDVVAVINQGSMYWNIRATVASNKFIRLSTMGRLSVLILQAAQVESITGLFAPV